MAGVLFRPSREEDYNRGLWVNSTRHVGEQVMGQRMIRRRMMGQHTMGQHTMGQKHVLVQHMGQNVGQNTTLTSAKGGDALHKHVRHS